MYYDEMSVVDGEGRVHGLEGSRVMRRLCRRLSLEFERHDNETMGENSDMDRG